MINLGRQGPERVFAVVPPEDVDMLRRKLANHPEYEMSLVGPRPLSKRDDRNVCGRLRYHLDLTPGIRVIGSPAWRDHAELCPSWSR